MKRLVILFALISAGPSASGLGCEGEPPVVAPENTPSLASGAAVAPGRPTSEPSSSPPQMTACLPPPCAPAASAIVPVGPSVAVASESTSASALPVPPQSIPRGNVVGAITAKPAAMAGQAVVYLEDGPNEDVPSHMQTVTIANRQMNFIPFVAVAAVGGKVVFTNEDPFPHNVFSPDNDKFNLGNIPQNGAHTRTFKTAGAYSLLCNLHPGMLGYLVVTPSTWFARTDGKGRFEMKHVPSGSYRVTAWAPRQAPVTQPVTVADGDVTVNFDLHR
ncbi:MAG: carboxypeptidase regulatory-like domain-containing protein [Myxococcota bacterium]|nr:carboxypeptidase regulatory-like domain-containing protein [Myxococcota bacterium]